MLRSRLVGICALTAPVLVQVKSSGGEEVKRLRAELAAAQAELAAAHTFLNKTGGTVHGAIAKLQGAGVHVFPHAHSSTTIPAPTFGDAEARTIEFIVPKVSYIYKKKKKKKKTQL